VEVAVGNRVPSPGPGLRDERDLVIGQFGERPHVRGRVDDHLLTLERRVEVRDDPDAPAG
jgi:hypothetical protein